MECIKLAVLISGRGSNMEKIIRACRYPRYPAEVAVVIADRHEIEGVSIARGYGINTDVIPYIDREQFAENADSALQTYEPHLVVLAGLMRILPADFVEKWPVINIHPSLLPKHPGINPHLHVIENKETMSGCTVHWAVPEVDTGQIISQMTVPVLPGDTPTDLAARVLLQEHRLYPMTIKMLALQMLAGKPLRSK